MSSVSSCSSTPYLSVSGPSQPLPISVVDTKLIDTGSGKFAAKSVVAIKNPATGKTDKYVITHDDLELIDGDRQKTIDKVKDLILHADEKMQTVILLGITHLTPDSTTKNVHFEDDEFTITKRSGRAKSYGEEVQMVMPLRFQEVHSKHRLWNTINALTTQDRDDIPEDLRLIKDKLPNGPITAGEQQLIDSYLFIDATWYEFNGLQWLDVATNAPATRPLPPYCQINSRGKDITKEELADLPKKLEKWQTKYDALNEAARIDQILRARRPKTSTVTPPKPVTTSSIIQDSHHVSSPVIIDPPIHDKAETLRQKAHLIPENTADNIKKKISILEQIPALSLTDEDEAVLGNLYNQLGVMTSDMQERRQYLEKAANLGNNYGAYNLAQMYRNGEGGEQSDEKALHHFKQALTNDKTFKQVSPFNKEMTTLCEENIATLTAQLAPKVVKVKESSEQEIQLTMPQVVEEKEVIDYAEMKAKGIKAYEEGRYAEAYDYLKAALEEGNPLSNDPECLFYLGSILAEGKGGIGQDLAKAKELFKKAQALSGSNEELQKKAQIQVHTLKIRELGKDFTIGNTTYKLKHLLFNATFLENIENAIYPHKTKLEMIAKTEKNIKERKLVLERLHELAKQQPENSELAKLLSLAKERALMRQEMDRVNELYLG